MSTGKKSKNIKTFIIIATMEVGERESFARMFLQSPKGEVPQGLRFGDIIPLDKPMIISPKGFKSLEVIPVTEDIVIHGKNIQRRVKRR